LEEVDHGARGGRAGLSRAVIDGNRNDVTQLMPLG
jgi:hypothetical protein